MRWMELNCLTGTPKPSFGRTFYFFIDGLDGMEWGSMIEKDMAPRTDDAVRWMDVHSSRFTVHAEVVKAGVIVNVGPFCVLDPELALA